MQYENAKNPEEMENPGGETSKYKGEYDMDSRTNIDDFLTVRGFASPGFGFGYGGYGGFGGAGTPSSFANPGANAVRLNRNAQTIEDQADCTRQVLGIQNAWTRGSFENLTRDNQFNRICDKLSDFEFRQNDRLRDQDREINANAREMAKCCCDTQKEILELKADTNLRFSEVKAGQATILERLSANKEISELRAQLQTQSIFAQCGCGCGGGVRNCPPAQ